TPGQFELSCPIDTRVGNGFVEGDFRRPLRDGVVAFATFVETDLHGQDFVEHFRSPFGEEIGETGSGSSVDDRGTILFFEAFYVAELFGLKWIARKVGAEVQIVSAKAQGCAQDNFIKNGS